MMKALRNNLSKAREEYRSLHYPGDLSADVLGAPQRVLEYGTHRKIHRVLWAGAAVAAMAAAIAVVLVGVKIFNRPAPEQARLIVHPRYDDNDDELSLGSIPVVSAADSIPQDLSMSPSAQTMSVSMPSLSFWANDSQQQDTQQSPQSYNTSTSSREEAVL